MLGDLRDWLAGFDAPAEARPLDPETEAVNRRQLRRSWVDVSYRSAMAPTDALRAIGGTEEAWWKPTGLGELSGPVGCGIAAVVEQDSSWVGGGLLFALFGVAFVAAVIGTGWQADGRPDPLAAVVEAIDGTVRPSGRRPAPPPPPQPPLVSPYRR